MTMVLLMQASFFFGTENVKNIHVFFLTFSRYSKIHGGRVGNIIGVPFPLVKISISNYCPQKSVISQTESAYILITMPFGSYGPKANSLKVIARCMQLTVGQLNLESI